MNRINFWDEQAAKGVLSGTQDRTAKNLEMRSIAAYVKDGMKILDIGCGDGEMLRYLGRSGSPFKDLTLIGIDSSVKMIEKAKEITLPTLNINFEVFDIKYLNILRWSQFDLIYTQRCLINLASWEEQHQAILDIASLLKPGGLYLMVENFQEGLDEINVIRMKVGLMPITPPWHNLYLRDTNLLDLAILGEPLILEEIIPFSAAYFFMSRVVNAWLAAQEGREPEYGAPINRLGAMLDPKYFNIKGQTQLWVWRKL